MNFVPRPVARALMALGCGLLLPTVLSVVLPSVLWAQAHGGGGQMAQGAPGGGGQQGSFPGSSNGVGSNSPFGAASNTNAANHASTDPNAVVMGMDTGSPSSSIQSGLQLGPPERWWDEKKFRKMLDLTPDQQRQLDAIFNANKSSILEHYQAVDEAQQRMNLVCKRTPLDEASVFSEIDRLTTARAELEKAYAHLWLTLRQGLDAKQIERLKSIK